MERKFGLVISTLEMLERVPGSGATMFGSFLISYGRVRRGCSYGRLFFSGPVHIAEIPDAPRKTRYGITSANAADSASTVHFEPAT